MSELERFTRRKIVGILEHYRIDDDALEQALIEACWAVRAWQPAGPEAPKHPGIAMIERVAGRAVPATIAESLLKDMGDATEEQLKAARVDWVKKNPRNPDAWTWVSWAKHAGKDNRKRQAQEQAPAGFSGLQEWLNARQ